MTISSGEAGKTCPYCRFPLKQGAPGVCCDACGTIHHEECWEEAGGCVVVGCSGAGTTTPTAAPRGVTSPDPRERSSTATGVSGSQGAAHGRNLMIALATSLAIGAVGVGAYFALQRQGTPQSSAQTTPASTTQPPATETVQTTVTTTTSSSPGTTPAAQVSTGESHTAPTLDVVAYSLNGVRYRYSPRLADVVPGNGPFRGSQVAVACYAIGENVHGNRFWARLANSYYVPAYYLRRGHSGMPPGVSRCGGNGSSSGQAWSGSDLVSYSTNGVRYRFAPRLADVIPGNGPFTGASVHVSCFTEGQDVRGNPWWARLSDGYYVPAYYLVQGHSGLPAGAPTC
jgi:hypothetical protein